MIKPQHLERSRTQVCDQEEGRGRPHVINEELFRGVLSRERKRSDRSNQPVALLLLGVKDGLGADSSSVWEAAIAALAAVKRETDILGWFEWRAVVGVIVPEIRASDPANTCEGLDARVRRTLAKRLGTEAVAKFSIRLHVYPEPKLAGEEGFWLVNPLFYPERRSRSERRAIDDGIKRGLDVVGSLTLLMMLSPLLLLIAALVKLSSHGPVLFRQVRIGQMMKPFTMLKFRTMYANADHRPHHEFVSSFIKASGQIHQPGDNGLFKLTNDPRVTPVGRILRKTSLDELPQLWNDVKLAKFINLYGCEIGDETKIGAFVEIQKNAKVGRRCKISSHTFICEGVTIEDHVLIGHGVTFINDSYPRATTPTGELQSEKDWKVEATLVRRGASIGSGATILSNVVIGENAIVGAGSVVTRDVPDNAIVAGNPARVLRLITPELRLPQ